jgi:hypothetical protein
MPPHGLAHAHARAFTCAHVQLRRFQLRDELEDALSLDALEQVVFKLKMRRDAGTLGPSPLRPLLFFFLFLTNARML